MYKDDLKDSENNILGIDINSITNNLNNIQNLSIPNYQADYKEQLFHKADFSRYINREKAYVSSMSVLENTEYLFDNQFQNATFLAKRNGNYEAFSNFKIKNITTKKFDNPLLLEEQVIIEVRTINNLDNVIILPKSKLTNPKELIELFQQQASVSFLSKRKPEIDGKLLSNLIFARMQYSKLLYVRCFNGWVLDKEPKFFFKNDDDLPSSHKVCNYELNYNDNIDHEKSLSDFARTSDIFNEEIMFVVISLWSVYSTLYTIFTNLNLKINKILVLDCYGLPIDEFLDFFFQPYVKSSFLNSKTKVKITKDVISIARDCMVLINDNVKKDKKDKDLVNSNFSLILDYFTSGQPIINKTKENEITRQYACSTVTVVSNSLFAQYPDKCIGLCINNNNVQLKRFLILKEKRNLLANFIYTIVTYIEKNYAIIENIIKKSNNKYNDFKCFENESNANAFSILMATYEIIDYIYKAYGLNFTSIVYNNKEIRIDSEIANFIGNNEVLEDTTGYADSFIKLLKIAIKNDVFNKYYMTNYSESTEFNQKKPSIFFDENYIYISRDDVNNYIWSNSNFSHLSINIALKDLKNKDYIKTDASTFEPKVLIEPLINSGKIDQRVRMLHISRKKIERIFDEPLFEEEFYVTNEKNN